ncbi:PspC domain-containing protein [Microbacteriaceae bacterium VKM Ac-2854]|nr:PspC domain-containing protein [Microbacteriaceae bacterium VKM Ac-2854]
MTDLSLAGHAGAFELTVEARGRILDYLAQARAAASNGRDGDDIARDLETAIGDRLQAHLDGGAEIDDATVQRILDRFGLVETTADTSTPLKAPLLCRIEEGKQISGLFLGLATRTDLRVDWMRSIAVILGVFTGGLLVVAYLIALLFAPRLPSVAEYQRVLRADRSARDRREAGRRRRG